MNEKLKRDDIDSKEALSSVVFYSRILLRKIFGWIPALSNKIFGSGNGYLAIAWAVRLAVVLILGFLFTEWLWDDVLLRDQLVFIIATIILLVLNEATVYLMTIRNLISKQNVEIRDLNHYLCEEEKK